MRPAQGIRQPGQQQHIGRAGQQEPSRAALAVDDVLERGEQRGHPLDLVQDYPRKAVHEAVRVGLGGGAHRVLVEAQVVAAQRPAHHLRQRGLAALARPVYQHHRRVAQRLAQQRRGLAGVEDGGGYRLIERIAGG